MINIHNKRESINNDNITINTRVFVSVDSEYEEDVEVFDVNIPIDTEIGDLVYNGKGDEFSVYDIIGIFDNEICYYLSYEPTFEELYQMHYSDSNLIN